eukprot:TRINITY_DN8708_c0_g1_i1.p2 TRINITY_DN8708_c0_g1~~TRINITY_DN8708_c0_g1_i1.p2  ORF type:complete len:126 (+),score=39.14 TRINITY_DN8708_c0_g1_i1:115-492(+)
MLRSLVGSEMCIRDRCLEQSRADKQLPTNSQAAVSIGGDCEQFEWLHATFGEDQLARLLMTSTVTFEPPDPEQMRVWSCDWETDTAGQKLQVGVRPTSLSKCPRCWRFDVRAGAELCRRCESVMG